MKTLRFQLSVVMMFKKFLIKIQDQFFTAVALLIFVTFFVMTVWGENGILKLVALKHLKENVATENATILKQNLLFVQEIEKLKQSKFVEQRARTDLGYVRPNETVFVMHEKENSGN